MLEDTFLEEDIWKYKSKRKPKPVHTNNCTESIPKSVEKPTDGKCQSKQKGKKARTIEATGKVKDHEMCLGESQTSVSSSQNSSCGDDVQLSQDKAATPRKHCRAHKNRQVSPKIRPVYDGHCPNCQMPFSSLLGQTPRWHVFECLDSPPISDTECPDGLLCTSTIPSHYKKYTHLLLAQRRASNDPFSGPPHAPGGSSSETKPAFSFIYEEKWCLPQKQTENLKNVSNDPLLMIQNLKTSQLTTEANKKISSTNTQTSQQALQSPEFVKIDKLVGAGLSLIRKESDSQRTTQHTNLPLSENDFSSCEISYSPLQSDEETYDINEKLDDSQQELFCTRSPKDGSLEDDDSSAELQNLHGHFLRNAEEICPRANSFFTQDKNSEGLHKCRALGDSFHFTSQAESGVSYDPAFTDYFLLFPPALAGNLPASSYQTTKAKPHQPEFHSSQSNKQKQVIEESAVDNQASLPLLNCELSKSQSQGGRCLSLHSSQSKIRELSRENFRAKNNANSACVCRKTLDGMPEGKVTLLSTGKSRTSTAANSSRKLSSSPKGTTRHFSKAMKQMDIGVYFGLPPKRKEEKSMEESALEVMNLNPATSPNKKRPRQCKRKAEKSLSDLEFDANDLSESQFSMELSDERSQRQRKRRKKSNSQEGTHQKRSGHLINSTESECGTVKLSKDKDFIKSAPGRLQRGNMKVSESPNTGELRKRTCPFYKKIPGTGFTVDAFQYGAVEGCTAYFLTHFHSDHYAGLSRSFTFPIYCSEVTASLLKSKLHVQEQYIHPLPMDTECIINGVRVILLDANHCPGAAMILFYLPNGTVVLHTGDFRADPSMERSLLAGQKVHVLYLDTTYCSPEYTFPSQQEVIQFAINTAFEAVTQNPRALVVCGTYCIGKEKVFLAIADVLGSKVGMSEEKYKTLRCLNISEINSLITTDMYNSLVHLLPMMQINFKNLQSHLKKYGGKYDQILAFRPTGWTHSNKLTCIADVTPKTKGNISIYGIPYSEHSSYLEMKRFVQWLKPQKIIPTVNVGTWKSRSTMEKYFKEWKFEAGY
ncbi:PREDICTED: DNA cross-link repair 1A protein [Chinchilla lanigera]|uniref:DNA cross-link repair 1A protein n=1 Tax=Chinchilla lanigera TaxID=34839 RepID=A0A8C2W3I5_CHILA|nr:PREDICTED: DNA cross-link repair 1A protein [Chinchilla lanigera]XP_005387866.1 PREDICTED: DNA cross-link repair 1A protein [Chinchilla lanigera]